ncbi:MAG: type I restriction-modification system subunit M N-terminal domain-containing protein [Desulfobacterales bacterium]
MDINSLSAHLWESANILRGPVDAADFKTYIFTLLFFKRILMIFSIPSSGTGLMFSIISNRAALNNLKVM